MNALAFAPTPQAMTDAAYLWVVASSWFARYRAAASRVGSSVLFICVRNASSVSDSGAVVVVGATALGAGGGLGSHGHSRWRGRWGCYRHGRAGRLCRWHNGFRIVRAEIGCAEENQRTSDGDDQGDECRPHQWTASGRRLDLGGVVVTRPREVRLAEPLRRFARHSFGTRCCAECAAATRRRGRAPASRCLVPKRTVCDRGIESWVR